MYCKFTFWCILSLFDNMVNSETFVDFGLLISTVLISMSIQAEIYHQILVMIITAR